MNREFLERIFGPIKTRIANLIARGVVKLVKDGGGMQLLQLDILEGETRDGIERIQQYGFTSVPLDGAEAVVLFVGGRREHGLVVAVDDRRYRLKGLEKGEVALYSKAGGKVVLKADGSIEVGGGTLQPAALGQDVRDELDDIRAKFAAHTHPVPSAGLVSATAGSPVTGAAVSSSTTATLAAAKTVKSAAVKVKA